MQHKTMAAPMIRENYLLAVDAIESARGRSIRPLSGPSAIDCAAEIARGLCMHDAVMRVCPNRYGCDDISARATSVTTARALCELRGASYGAKSLAPRAITFSKTLTKASVQQNNMKMVCQLRQQTGDPFVTFDVLQAVCTVAKALGTTPAPEPAQGTSVAGFRVREGQSPSQTASVGLMAEYRLCRDDVAKVIRTNRMAIGISRSSQGVLAGSVDP
jgi:hypothetical protein